MGCWPGAGRKEGEKNLAMRNEHQEEDDDRCNGKSTPSCFIPLHEAGRTVSAVAAEIKRFDICVQKVHSQLRSGFLVALHKKKTINTQILVIQQCSL